MHFFILPFSWALVLFLLVFVLKSKKWKRRCLIASFSVLLFFSNTVIFKEFARMWEVKGKSYNEVGHYDVGIVLGGMAEYNNDFNRLSIRRGGDRIWQAIALYKRGKIDKILISGDDGVVIDRGLKEAIQFKKELLVWGIPDEDILIETTSKNTYQNALMTIQLLHKKYNKTPRCLLITSALHIKRARACFSKLGFYVVPFPTDHYTGPNRAYHIDEYFVPSVETMAHWGRLIHEWVGFIMYKISGYC